MRLGIVVSVTWFLVSASLYFAGIATYPSRVTTALTRFYSWVDSPGGAVRDAHGIDFTPLEPVIHAPRLMLLTILPLVVGWLLLYVAPASIRWIRAGFRSI